MSDTECEVTQYIFSTANAAAGMPQLLPEILYQRDFAFSFIRILSHA
jgi:hypothetical protein